MARNHSAAVVALVLSIFVVAILYALLYLGRKQRRLRFLAGPDFAGGMGTLLGLIFAVAAQYVSDFQLAALVLALGFLAWWGWTYIANFQRNDRRALMAFSRRAMNLSAQAFTLLSEYQQDSQFATVFRPLYSSATTPLGKMQDGYFKTLRFAIPDYLNELDGDDIEYDKSLLGIALKLGTSPHDVQPQPLEDLASGLWRVALDLESLAEGQPLTDWSESV